MAKRVPAVSYMWDVTIIGKFQCVFNTLKHMYFVLLGYLSFVDLLEDLMGILDIYNAKNSDSLKYPLCEIICRH